VHQLEKLVKLVDGRSSTRARWLAGALHWPHTPHAALAAQSLEHGALGTPHRSPRPAAKPPVSPRTPLQSPRGAAAAAAAVAAASDQANAFHYDEELVEERLEGLHQLRAAAQERARAAQAQAGKPQGRAAREEARNAALHLFEGLRADVVGGPNCGHMAAREVHRHGLRTPAPIKGFVAEVKKGIAALVALTSPPVAEPRGRAAEGEREASPTSALDLGALLESTDLSPRRVPPPAKGLRLKDRLLRRKDSGNPLSHMEGMKALLELERAHGKAALVLSGGGSFGAFHLGVVRKLHERNVLPRVVAGSSSGALIGAIVCTRTPSELALTLHRDYLEENARGYFGNGPLKMLASFLRKGYLQDVAHFQGWLMDLFGPMTFQEAYERSGRSLSICVSQAHSKEPPRLLNHVTAPHVLVWSAVACSCAFPCLFPAQELFVKGPDGRIMEQSQMIRRTASSKWRDGCLTENLPLQGLQELFNVNFVLASQANLFLSAWLSTKNTVIGEMSEASLMLDMAEEGGEALVRRAGARPEVPADPQVDAGVDAHGDVDVGGQPHGGAALELVPDALRGLPRGDEPVPGPLPRPAGPGRGRHGRPDRRDPVHAGHRERDSQGDRLALVAAEGGAEAGVCAGGAEAGGPGTGRRPPRHRRACFAGAPPRVVLLRHTRRGRAAGVGCVT